MWIDFIEGVTAAEEYLYDDNCNMTKDLNKGISDIQYTVLKLQNIVDGKTIAYCGDSGAYEYNLTDHLGNVSAVIKVLNIKIVFESKIMEEYSNEAS